MSRKSCHGPDVYLRRVSEAESSLGVWGYGDFLSLLVGPDVMQLLY